MSDHNPTVLERLGYASFVVVVLVAIFAGAIFAWLLAIVVADHFGYGAWGAVGFPILGVLIAIFCSAYRDY